MSGIGFALSDGQLALQRKARAFAREQVVPSAARFDRNDGDFPTELIEQARRQGLLHTNIPRHLGGPGLSVVEQCLVAEELAWGCAGIAAAIMTSHAAATFVTLVATEAQPVWPKLLSDGRLAAPAITEPGAGSDLAGIETVAVRGTGSYVLEGTKTMVSNIGENAFLLVAARTATDPGGRNLSLFVVPTGSEGVSVTRRFRKLGQRASGLGEVQLSGVTVPDAQRLGSEGEGLDVLREALNRNRPCAASLAVGVARRAMEEAISYSTERRTFGVPICSHQSVGNMIAEMAINVEAARLLTWRAAWSADTGSPDPRQSASAKAFSADVAVRTCLDAVQILGGWGYLEHYPVEKLLRDAKAFQIVEGTSEIQRSLVARWAASEIMGQG